MKFNQSLKFERAAGARCFSNLGADLTSPVGRFAHLSGAFPGIARPVPYNLLTDASSGNAYSVRARFIDRRDDDAGRRSGTSSYSAATFVFSQSNGAARSFL